MSEILHLVLSAYIVFVIFDLAHSWRRYSDHKFISFDKPTKSWLSFFVDDHKWSVGTCVVFAFIGWGFVV